MTPNSKTLSPAKSATAAASAILALPRLVREFGRAHEPALRLAGRSCDNAVAEFVAVEQFRNGLEIRAAINRVQWLGGAPEDIKLIVGERNRRHGWSPPLRAIAGRVVWPSPGFGFGFDFAPANAGAFFLSAWRGVHVKGPPSSV